MKTRLLIFKPLILLAFLPFIVLAGSAFAADFFPLDIWQEIVAWRSKKSGSEVFVIKGDHRPKSSVAGAAAKASDAFPWDVREELNALGSDTGCGDTRFYGTSDITGRSRVTPYWLPAELRSDPRPAAACPGFEEYLTDSR